MKIWFYCSYSGSPVGFQLGVVDTTCLTEHLSSGKPHRLMDRCLSYQGIKEAYGKIPGTDSYVAVRPISRQEGDRVYLNFAFETEDASEFNSIVEFLKRYRGKDSALFRLMLPTVVEDIHDSSFGIRVNVEELTKIIESNISKNPSRMWYGGFYVCTRDAEQKDMLNENLRLSRIYPEMKCSFISEAQLGKNWYKMSVAPVADKTTSEKNHDSLVGEKTIPFVFLIVAGLIVLLLIGILITNSQKNTTTAERETKDIAEVENSQSESQIAEAPTNLMDADVQTDNSMNMET